MKAAIAMSIVAIRCPVELRISYLKIPKPDYPLQTAETRLLWNTCGVLIHWRGKIEPLQYTKGTITIS